MYEYEGNTPHKISNRKEVLAMTNYKAEVQSFVSELSEGIHDLNNDYSLHVKPEGMVLYYRENIDEAEGLEDVVNALVDMIPTTTGIRWENALKELDAQKADYHFDFDTACKILYVGSQTSFAPSGKIYAFWTSNQTEWDVLADELYWEMFSKECSDHDVCEYIESGDVFIVKQV